MTNLEGQTFAGYEIISKLGQGGMGAVYKARQTMLNRLVALKVMAEQINADPGYVARFIREASAAANLNHPNMVQVYTAGEHDGIYFIAMEFVEGESLRKRLDRLGRIAPEEAVAVAVYIAQALQYAWNKSRLIHRDIKPDNIFLSDAGEVKVGDLGLAKSVGMETTELTQSGVTMGSPHYISPEQAQAAKDIDFRTDIYSLGCTLYHMLTGKTPYTGDSAMTVILKHVNEPPPAIFKTWAACPMPLGLVVGKMLAKDPNARPRSYEQLVAELLEVHEKLKNLQSVRPVAVRPTAPPPVKTSAPPPVAATVLAGPAGKPKSMKAMGIAAGAVAAIALGGLLLWSPWKQSTGPESAVQQPAPAQTVQNTTPSSTAAAAWQDLIPLVNPQRDASNGDWKMENGKLVCARADGWSMCEVPVDYSGGNYDLRIRVTRGEGSQVGMFFAFRKGSTGGDVIFDFVMPRIRDGFKRIGLEKRRDHALEDPDLAVAGKEWIPKGQEVVILLQVRDDSLAVQLNDKEVLRWSADWSQLEQGVGFDKALFKRFNGRPIFGVGIFNCQATYHAIEMREVAGGTTVAALSSSLVLRRPPEPSPDDLRKIEDALPAKAAAPPQKPRRLAVFSRCEGYRHDNGIAAAAKAIELMGQKTGAYETDFTDDYSLFDAASLTKYDAVVFNNTSKLSFPDAARQQALLDFARGGKGVIGIHAATDNFPDWPEGTAMIGGMFDGHPWGASGTWAFKLDAPDHVLNRAFGGKGFKLKDEIYQMKEPYTRAGRQVLLTLDLSDPATGGVKRGINRTDGDFAVAWIKPEGNGRVFYCGLGHAANVFQEPAVLQFYLDGIQYALGDLKTAATASSFANTAAWQNAINLMPLIDPQQDALVGEWSVRDGELTGSGRAFAHLEIPYRPPEEYDYRIEFTHAGPPAGGGCQHIARAGRGFTWNFFGTPGRAFGFEMIDNKGARENGSGVLLEFPQQGRRYVSLVEVRATGVRGYLDGKLISDWKTDYSNMKAFDAWKLRDPTLLGVGCSTRMVFRRIEVREITGKGKFMRAAPSTASPPPPPAASAPVAGNGLVLHLNFDEPPAQGIVRDMSGRGNHGRVEGATWVPDGRFGGAMRFDIRQRTQRVRVPNSDSLNPRRITIAAWIKSADADEFWNRIGDKDWRRGYNLCLGGKEPNKKDWSGHVGVEINGHPAFSDGRVADGQWHHVAGTYDGQVQLLYVDGRLQKPRARWTGTISANNDDLCIGNTLVNYDSQEFLAFDGLIDEFRIYDRALSGEEIAGLMNISGQPSAAATFDPSSLRYGLYFHFDITTFTGYQDMSRVGKAPTSLFAPKALDVRQWARVAREAGATFAVLTAKHEAGFCMWPAKDSDYHVGLSPAKTDIVGEFVTACKAEGLKVGVHYSVPDARVEGQVKFRGPVEPAHFEIIKKHLAELTSRYPDIAVYVVDCAQRLSPEQFGEVTSLLKQANPQRLILQTPLGERRGRIPSIPGVQEHNAVTVNKNWFWAPNAPLTPASKLFEEWQNSSQRNFPLLVNVGPDRDGRIPDEYVAVLAELKRRMTP